MAVAQRSVSPSSVQPLSSTPETDYAVSPFRCLKRHPKCNLSQLNLSISICISTAQLSPAHLSAAAACPALVRNPRVRRHLWPLFLSHYPTPYCKPSGAPDDSTLQIYPGSHPFSLPPPLPRSSRSHHLCLVSLIPSLSLLSVVDKADRSWYSVQTSVGSPFHSASPESLQWTSCEALLDQTLYLSDTISFLFLPPSLLQHTGPLAVSLCTPGMLSPGPHWPAHAHITQAFSPQNPHG